MKHIWRPSSIRTVRRIAKPHERREANLLPVVAELVLVQEWNELEDEFEERCGGQRMKSLLTHGGRRQTGRQRLDQDGGRQVDLALKDAGPKAQEGSKTESGPSGIR